MDRRTSARVVLFLLTLIPTATRAAEGFFTGSRAEVIAQLREAHQPRIRGEDAITIVARARSATDGLDDPYLDFFIDQALAMLYHKLGDTDASAARLASAMERYAFAIKKDGPAQAMYTMYLISYDIELPVAALFGGENAQFSQLRGVDAELESALNQIESLLEDPDLDPKTRQMLLRQQRDLKRIITNLAEGLSQGDAEKLRRARKDVLRSVDDMHKHAKGLSDEDERLVAGMRGMMAGMIDLAIAAAERNRKAYEKAARTVATHLNELLDEDDESEQ